MLINSVRVILRQMRSVYSLINLIGLVIGFTVFILIFLWLQEEKGYDRFHADHTNIYRIVKDTHDEKGGVSHIALTPGPTAAYLHSTYPQVTQACRLTYNEFCIRTEENCFYKKGIAVDTTFFRVFDFQLAKGKINDFTTGANKIIISQSLAKTFFGESNPLGKIFIIGPRELLVVGVLEKIPTNTHLGNFDYILPLEFLQTNGLLEITDWSYSTVYTYIKVKLDRSINSFEEQIKNSIKKNHPESTSLIKLQPLTDIHLKSTHLSNDIAGRGNELYVTIFSFIAFLVLTVACINYANLATARLVKRAKETGVRKVLGSSQKQLLLFFFTESFLYTFFAMLLGIGIAWIALPYFNQVSGKQLAIQVTSYSTLLPLVVAGVICSILSGFYPAIAFSTQNPITILKGLAKAGKKTIALRSTLVVVQFVLSIGLLSATFIVQKQVDFTNTKALGYDKENIITFTAVRKILAQYETFKNELQNLPEVKSVTANNYNLSNLDESTSDVTWEGKADTHELLFNRLIIDFDYLNTYSIELAAGRDFQRTLASDSSAILLNEEAVANMNVSDPLHKIITVNAKKYTVIGIVKNFHFKSLHKKIEPLILYIDPSQFYTISVKLQKGNVETTTKAVEEVFKKFAPERPFDYTFLEDELQRLYNTEKRTSIIFQFLSSMALVVSCMGLLGIVMFVTEQRQKELAIRKVMGASVPTLLLQLSSEYLLLVLLAFCMAAPVSYYLMDKWLDNFAYRIDLPVGIFIVTGCIVLLITWLTVLYHTYQSATCNPIRSLRSE